MASIEKEFEVRALKTKLDVNEKVKFRRYMEDLRVTDRKASIWSGFHILSEIIFFWSILTAAMVTSELYLQGKLPEYIMSYFSLIAGFFRWFEGPTYAVLPYAFVLMMLFGTFRGNAERDRTKTMTFIIALLTFAEQKDLLLQMQKFTNSRVSATSSSRSREAW